MPDTPQQVFDAMPGAFRPEKAGSAEMLLQFSLTGNHGGDWTIDIANGRCQTHSGPATDPLATISASDQDFMALFRGDLNAVAAYMSGRVQVQGDVTAIMNLLSFFELPEN